MNHRQMTLWPTSRRGSILPWFAVSLFVLLPLAALVIDMSLVRLARRQMQTAVNAAALEGLRWRDEDPDHRRDKARAVGLSVFSRDLLSTDEGAPSLVVANNLKYSGGTEIAGAGSFHAGALIELNGIPIYNPKFQLNSGNDLDGDLVTGDFILDSLTLEQADEEPGDAFLARLQRTGQSGMTGVRSDGDPVPFLFGRGGVTAALPPYDPAAIWNRRERGTIVRTTAIAHSRRAMRVGVPSAEISQGVADCWLNCAAWAGLADGDILTVNGSGQVLNGSMIQIGQFRTDDSPFPSPFARAVVSVGDVEPNTSVMTVSLDSVGQVRFAPLVLEILDTWRTVGFGRLTVISSTEIRKENIVVAHTNASATFGQVNSVSDPAWQALFAESTPYTDQFLQAPALQRTIP